MHKVSSNVKRILSREGRSQPDYEAAQKRAAEIATAAQQAEPEEIDGPFERFTDVVLLSTKPAEIESAAIHWLATRGFVVLRREHALDMLDQNSLDARIDAFCTSQAAGLHKKLSFEEGIKMAMIAGRVPGYDR